MARKKMSFSYDKQADVLYLSMGNPRKSISHEVEDGIILRFDAKKKHLSGVTIMDFQARFQKAKPRSIDVTVNAHVRAA